MSDSSISYFTGKKKQILEAGIGRTCYTAYSIVADFFVYPFAIGWFGWIGAIVMPALSLIQCGLTLIWYQRCGRDWLGIGIIESVKRTGRDRIKRFMRLKIEGNMAALLVLAKIVLALPAAFSWIILWLLNSHDVLVFFGLCIVEDPFEITVYFKKADFTHKSLTKKDWCIFWASWFVGNLYWVIYSGAVAFAFIWVWKKIHGR